MPAHKPAEAHTFFEEAFNAGDLNALVELYEPEAVAFDNQGQLVEGSQAIGETLQSFLAWKSQIKLVTKRLSRLGALPYCGESGN